MAATSKAALFPRELLEQSAQARRDYFRAYTVAHPTLAAVDQQVSTALREPGGALLIFVVGPTGVGKSTFLDHLEHRLIEQMLPLLELDPGRFPVVKLQAKAPAAREFRWANFYTRGLLALQEPLLNYKVNPHAVSALHQGMRRKPLTNTLAADVDLLQLVWEQAIAQRRPAAILIDEAQHMGKTGRGSKLLEHLDHLKCLAITTQTVHVLVGTYQLLAFRNLSAQLCRRSIDVHFPRYQATNKKDVYAFKNVLLAFQRHLPVEEMPDFLSHWQTCYAYTAGCVGLLKEWLLRALSQAVETGEKTVSPALLLQHAPSAKRCEQIITEIEEGEGHFHHDEGVEDRLRSRLGLEPRRTSPVPKAEQQQKETGQPLAHASGKAVGQRLATRDPLKGGADICE